MTAKHVTSADDPRKKLTLAIQAGGHSTRMGQDKAALQLAGLSLLQRVIRQVSGLTDAIFVVSNDSERLQNTAIPTYPDLLPTPGALSGFYTAFACAKTEYVAMLACDMPFASKAIFARCFELILESGADVVMPKSGEYLFEPLHAVYRRQPCQQAVLHALQNGQHRLISWLDQVNVAFLPPDECQRLDPSGLAFYNLNTREDLEQALEYIRAEENKNQS